MPCAIEAFLIWIESGQFKEKNLGKCDGKHTEREALEAFARKEFGKTYDYHYDICHSGSTRLFPLYARGKRQHDGKEIYLR